jgi:hypothetical protein
VHSLCPVKFEAQQIFGAFEPPSGTKFNDKFPPDSWKANGRNLTSQ